VNVYSTPHQYPPNTINSPCYAAQFLDLCRFLSKHQLFPICGYAEALHWKAGPVGDAARVSSRPVGLGIDPDFPKVRIPALRRRRGFVKHVEDASVRQPGEVASLKIGEDYRGRRVLQVAAH